jgi:hypothetical protein
LLISTLNEVEMLMGWSRQIGQVAGAVIEAPVHAHGRKAASGKFELERLCANKKVSTQYNVG